MGFELAANSRVLLYLSYTCHKTLDYFRFLEKPGAKPASGAILVPHA